jgi:hypothetical protein
MGTFQNDHEKYTEDNSKANKTTKDRTKKIAIASMRHFASSSIRFNDKMKKEEKEYMGVGERGGTNTPIPDPADLVEFEITTVPSDHHIVAQFHIFGSENRGKGPYHAAEVRFWVRGLDDPLPKDAEAEGWHSEATTRSPWEKSFTGDDEGKRLYIRMRWENTAASGTKGKGLWSPMQSVIIP